MADRNFTVRLSARVDAYVNAIKRAEQETHHFSRTAQRNMGKIGTQMQSFGRITTIGVSVPLLAAGAAATKAGIDWESAFTGVRKTVDGTASEISRLEDELRAMAGVLPASHTEIAAVAESAGQLGIKAQDIAGFTEVMIKLGDTTNVVGQEGAINMARFMNVMQTAPSRVGELGAILVELGNNTATTEQEILELSTRISGAGKIAGLSEGDVMALAAAITSVGVKAEAGGTATSKMLLMMNDAAQQGGAKLATLAQVAGVSMDEFSRVMTESPAQAFAMFIEGLRGVADSGQAVTPIFAELGVADERLMRAMRDTANAGPLLADALKLAADEASRGTALNIEAEKRYETVAAKLGMFRNRVVDLGIDLSEILIPMLMAGVSVAESFIDAFGAIPRPIQAIIMGLLGLTAAVGPAVWILGGLIRNIITLQGVIAKVKFASLVTPLGALLAAAGAVAAVFTVLKARSNAAAEAVRQQEQAVADLTKTLDAAPEPNDVLAQSFKDFAAENDRFRDSLLATETSFDDLVGAVIEGPAAFGIYADALVDAAIANGASEEEAYAFRQELEQQRVIMLSAYQAAMEMTEIQYGLGEATGETTEEIVTQTEADERAEEAAKAHAEEIERLTQKLEDERDALQETVDALQEKTDAYRASVDATFALRDAEDDFLGSLEDLNEILKETPDDLRAIAQGQDDVAESARDVADAHVLMAEDQATLEGRTLTATEKLDIFNESLLDQVANLEGPARDALLGYIADVNGIPEGVMTYIATLIDEGKLEDAETAIEMASRNRDTTVLLDTNEANLSDIEGKLNRITRDRNVNVTVGGAGAAGFRLLDRGGMGYPGDVVAEYGPELVDGKLVTIPTVLSRPSRVIGRDDTERFFEDRSSNIDQLVSGHLSPIPFAAQGPGIDYSKLAEAVREGGHRVGVQVEHYHDESGHALDDVFRTANAFLVMGV